MKKALIILAIVVAILALYAWGIYNKMIVANEGVDNMWAQVETQYQRRFDLIPNLVNSVKGAMAQEQKVFGDLADARTRYSGAATVNEKVDAATQIEGALGRLLVIMENYPQLKSVETVQTLMVQLEGTENRISVERKRFNDVARDFNVMVKRIPAKLFARMFGFSEKTYFDAATGAENAPAVKF
ncbi:LemA family protein [Patescibacteria group bacterium]|nr:LemA family protein [Patescibacteria group bacterium]MBU1663556.1 LemA family protein [Patescibacteria group bacterium]MBU1934206.1 LemA family protein [Patescibacteria group bacterium]MBU2007580.1 LemA family protein [Patescibacteria group bacterium]MBU2233792.1 LemA family protein [Patescibacteria group bacterium]